MDSILTYGSLILGAIVFIAILGFIGLKFYTLASKEIAFVRTGAGGQKVVLSGGAFVVPGIHEIVQINMKTLRLDVDKGGKDSLITSDRLRVDVKVDFYVRVKADEASVADAAQTLGALTMNPSQLKHQVEAKFVDALRAVAVKMSMYDLNSQRAEFVQEVQKVVAEDIAKNGLELESVSLTALNQTQKEYFDPTNAFDAEGLLVLTRETEARRKDVNVIEQDTAVQIATKNLQTEKEQQALRKQTEEVRLTTAQEIATLTASTAATTAANEAASKKQAETAEIAAKRDIATAGIEAARQTQEAQVTADASVNIKQQEQSILVAKKSAEEAEAQAAADLVRAKAAAADEAVVTARTVEIAERDKKVTLVKAREDAEKASISIVVASEAEKDAATNRAEALRVEATGAKDAALQDAEAIRAKGVAEAEALQKKTEAQNLLSPDQVAMQIRVAMLAALPNIISESVKPLANIESIRIAEVGGLNGGTSGSNGSSSTGGNGGNGGDGSLTDNVVSSALKYRVGAPLVDGLLREVGLDGGGGLTQMLSGVAGLGLATSPATAIQPSAPAADVSDVTATH